MMIRPLHLAALSAVLLAAGAARADDPGPGGTRPLQPVTGREVYVAVCQGCHMADGRGATGAATIPALAGNANLAEADYPVLLVLNGRGAMPWLRDTLKPAQIAAVATYVRTSFGNRWAKPVTPADVERVRKMAAGD